MRPSAAVQRSFWGKGSALDERAQASLPVAFGVAVLGIATFSMMDAVMKGLSLAIGVYSALFWRTSASAVIGGTIWAVRRRRLPGGAAIRLHLLRGAVSAVMATLFFWGLARVPMAQAIALTYIAPLIALFLAAWLLGERISSRAIIASLIAFSGVALILIGQGAADLGHDAFLGAMAVLASALCYSWNIILMRQQAMIAAPDEIAFFQSIIVALLLGLAFPWFGSLPHAADIPAILLGAALATLSLFLLSWAYARGPASYLAPTEYSSFIWAAFFGYWLFGEIVSPFTLAGATLIIAGCIWAARRGPIADTEAALS